MEDPTRKNVLHGIFWFALAGASVAVISLYIGEPQPYFVPYCGTIGGILGGLARLAFSASKKGAVIGAWIGGAIGGIIILDGIFHPIIAFGLTFQWHQLLILPFGIAFGSAIGSTISAAIGWLIKTAWRFFHER